MFRYGFEFRRLDAGAAIVGIQQQAFVPDRFDAGSAIVGIEQYVVAFRAVLAEGCLDEVAILTLLLFGLRPCSCEPSRLGSYNAGIIECFARSVRLSSPERGQQSSVVVFFPWILTDDGCRMNSLGREGNPIRKGFLRCRETCFGGELNLVVPWGFICTVVFRYFSFSFFGGTITFVSHALLCFFHYLFTLFISSIRYRVFWNGRANVFFCNSRGRSNKLRCFCIKIRLVGGNMSFVGVN